MDLTPEERDAVRRLLAQIRQVAEDFVHEYYGRMMLLAGTDRLTYVSVNDGGEAVLWAFADAVGLLDDPDKLSAAVAAANKRMDEDEAFAKSYDVRVETFHWAAKRCLGEAFTPEAEAGHLKLALLSRAAVSAGLIGRSPKRPV